MRSKVATAITKATTYNNYYLDMLRDGYTNDVNRALVQEPEDALDGWEPREELRPLKTIIDKIDKLNDEWERYKPLIWANPF